MPNDHWVRVYAYQLQLKIISRGAFQLRKGIKN